MAPIGAIPSVLIRVYPWTSLPSPSRPMTAAKPPIVFQSRVDALRPGDGVAFEWRPSAGGKARRGFVARLGAANFVAYENDCPHLGVPLDAGSNSFFDETGRLLVCSLHGAVFRPTDGECVGGPCRGDFLRPLPLELIEEGRVVAVLEPPPVASPLDRIPVSGEAGEADRLKAELRTRSEEPPCL